jgi:membrane-associated phospholipid phosphatase
MPNSLSVTRPDDQPPDEPGADTLSHGADRGWSTPPRAKFAGIPVPLWFFAAAALAVPTLDAPLARMRVFQQLSESLTAAIDRIETFGHGVGVAIILAAVWCLDPARRRYVPRLLAAALASGLSANLGKLLVARQRPYYWVEQGTGLSKQFLGWLPFGSNPSLEQSFPSGHTAAAFGLALGLSTLYPQGRVLFLTTAALVGVQRVIFDAHYVSDVLTSCGLAWLIVRTLFCAPAAVRFFARIERPAAPPGEEVPPAVRRAA